MNRVTIEGNLTHDAELRFTNSNTKVANFNLAVNRKYKTKSGEEKEEVCFIECEAWEWKAELMSERGTKGKRVLIDGRLKQHVWENAEGKKQSKHSIYCDHILFIEKKQKKEEENII